MQPLSLKLEERGLVDGADVLGEQFARLLAHVKHVLLDVEFAHFSTFHLHATGAALRPRNNFLLGHVGVHMIRVLAQRLIIRNQIVR